MALALWLIGSTIFSYIGGDRTELFLMGVLVLLGLGYGALSFWALYSVSKGYFREPVAEVDDEDQTAAPLD